ncbi:unnamed protein product [Haemonchus placei]|uniref:Adaptin_N domain-containing protein n=1 Tax=Haemonchus placei TaxID=6290 RepID=A0A0N4XBR1_HAEPC|nr:unnamed protein product [Haemonchus placei]
MSLLYECINTVIAVLISISAGGDHAASIQLCVQKLGVLIEDSDQNLKYLGLLAMGKILQTHPKAVQAHKDIVTGLVVRHGIEEKYYGNCQETHGARGICRRISLQVRSLVI